MRVSPLKHVQLCRLYAPRDCLQVLHGFTHAPSSACTQLMAVGGNGKARQFFKQHGWEELGADKIEGKVRGAGGVAHNWCGAYVRVQQPARQLLPWLLGWQALRSTVGGAHQRR